MSTVFKKKNIFKDMMRFAAVPTAMALITLVAVPIVSNVYPVGEYGKITLFYSTANVLTYAFLLGLDQSYIRYFYEPPEGLSSKDIRSYALLVGITVDLVVGVVVCVFAGKIVSECLFGDGDIFGLICLVIFILSQIALRLMNLEARMQNRAARYNIQTIGQNFITKIAFVAAAFFSTRYTYSILLMTISMVALVAFFFVKQHFYPSVESIRRARKQLKRLYKFGLPYMATALILNLNAYIGRIILGANGMFDAAGIFALAFTLAHMFNLVSTAFSLYWSPFMYENYKTEQSFIIKVHDYVMLVSLILVILIFLLQNAIFLIVGQNYMQAQSIFMLMMINPILSLVCETMVYGIPLKEKPFLDVVASSASLLINSAVTLMLVPKYGVMGAAVGVAASSVIMALLRTLFAQRLYKSIASPVKTMITSLLLIGLCSINYVMYDQLIERVILCAVVSIYLLIAYRKQILGGAHYVISLLSKRKRSAKK